MNRLPRELVEDRVVAVLRAPRLGAPAEVVRAIATAGIRCVELTFTIADVLAHIEATAGLNGIVVGAGTVLSASQARDAIAAGARFLVTPAVRPAVAEVAAAHGIPVLMGAFTPTEVAAAVDLGAAAVKIFPGETGGPAHLKALRGPFSAVPFMPSGGVSTANARDWLAAGAIAVSAGGSLAPADALARGDAATIGANAAAFVQALG